MQGRTLSGSESLCWVLTPLCTGEGDDLRELEHEVADAAMVSAGSTPAGVVTMNSTVRLLDLATGEQAVHALVFPENADIDENRISVLSPIGTAVLGCRVGDTIECAAPAGWRRFQVTALLGGHGQPSQPDVHGTS